MTDKQQHLQFIQDTINRMANHSFSLKGLTITFFAFIASGIITTPMESPPLIVYTPILIFWFLDAYYLAQERRFRSLYNVARQLPESKIDYSMDTAPIKQNHNNWGFVIFSRTLVFFYSIPLLLIWQLLGTQQ